MGDINKMTNKEFVKKHFNDAYSVAKDSGIFVETLLGQSILESSSGKSLLSTKYNNYFGIKADKSWNGKSVNMKTGEVFNGKPTNINANFRVYNSFQESAKDYINFLKNNPRYQNSGVFSAKNIEQQIQAIKDGGYATATNYVSNVMKIVRGIKDEVVNLAKSFKPKESTKDESKKPETNKLKTENKYNKIKIVALVSLGIISGYILLKTTKIIK